MNEMMESPEMSVGTKVIFKVDGTFDSKELRQPRQLQNRHVLPQYVDLHNIPFRVRHEGGYYFLESDKWNILSAFGESLMDAVGNMNQLIKDVIRDYIFSPQDSLSDDAKEFRSYLISHLMPL